MKKCYYAMNVYAAVWMLQKSKEACVTFIQIHKGGQTRYCAGSPFPMHFCP